MQWLIAVISPSESAIAYHWRAFQIESTAVYDTHACEPFERRWSVCLHRDRQESFKRVSEKF